MTKFSKTYALGADGWATAARLVRAIPDRWQIFDGSLRAPDARQPVPGTSIEISGDGPFGASIRNPEPHASLDGEHRTFLVLTGRHTSSAVFAVQGDSAGIVLARSFAAHCLEQRYSGLLTIAKGYGLSMDRSTRIAGHFHASIVIHLERKADVQSGMTGRVELAYSDEDGCRGQSEDIEPLLVICRELGLSERQGS